MCRWHSLVHPRSAHRSRSNPAYSSAQSLVYTRSAVLSHYPAAGNSDRHGLRYNPEIPGFAHPQSHAHIRCHYRYRPQTPAVHKRPRHLPRYNRKAYHSPTAAIRPATTGQWRCKCGIRRYKVFSGIHYREHCKCPHMPAAPHLS